MARGKTKGLDNREKKVKQGEQTLCQLRGLFITVRMRILPRQCAGRREFTDWIIVLRKFMSKKIPHLSNFKYASK